jgi:thioredoxin reductase
MAPTSSRTGNVHYRVRTPLNFHGKRLVIFGGGDSALDWVLDFCGKAASIVHVHRRPEFRAATRRRSLECVSSPRPVR